MAEERERDQLIPTTTAKFGQNSKGNTRIQLYVDKEVAEDLAALIVEKASQGAGTGVKFDIHQSKTTLDDGRTIEGAFFFVKSKMARNGAPAGGAAKKAYKPAGDKSTIEALKKKQVG